jgi:hypothetical protein
LSKPKFEQLINTIEIVIGVTGHRKLSDEDLIRDKIKQTLQNIEDRLNSILSNSKYKFSVLSPLAEGTDRITVEEVLKLDNSTTNEKSALDVILPLSKNDYIQDFDDPESREQFEYLLKRARSVKYFENCTNRDDSYYKSGRYIVDNCDILIAVWNGKPAAGLGGTADIVKYARDRDKWIFWINSESGAVQEEGDEEKLYLHIEGFNSEKVNLKKFNEQLEAQFNFLVKKAQKSKLPLGYIDILKTSLLPQFIKGDMLAQKYQKLYFIVGNSIYTLAAAAVATVTIQVLFFPEIPQIIWIEFILISIILILLVVSNIKDWHRKWIDYRYFSETLRSALFLKVANIKCNIPQAPPHLGLAIEKDWTSKAFFSVWKNNQDNKEMIPFLSFKKFLIDGWFTDQMNYYQKASLKNEKNHEIFTRLGEIFFVLTLIVAVFHALNFEILPHLLTTIAILLPTSAAALTGIRNNHEYIRNAKRYKQMAHTISNINERALEVENMESLVSLLEKANQVMLGEHQDWRVIVQYHKLQPP